MIRFKYDDTEEGYYESECFYLNLRPAAVKLADDAPTLDLLPERLASVASNDSGRSPPTCATAMAERNGPASYSYGTPELSVLTMAENDVA